MTSIKSVTQNKKNEKVVFDNNYLLLTTVLISIAILFYFINQMGKRKRSIVIYKDGSFSEKDISLNFKNNDDYQLFKHISKKTNLRRKFMSYETKEIQYPNFRFTRIFSTHYRDWVLAINDNNDAIIVSDFKNLDKYCSRINPLRSKTFNLSSLTNEEFKNFITFHIDNNYLHYYIIWENNVKDLKFDPISRNLYFDKYEFRDFDKSSYHYLKKTFASIDKYLHFNRNEFKLLVIDKMWSGHKINTSFRTKNYNDNMFYARFIEVKFSIKSNGEITAIKETTITNFLLYKYLQ